MDIGTVMYWLENARNHELFVISKLLDFCKLLLEDNLVILILNAILGVVKA
jgi:hypothetical protein